MTENNILRNTLWEDREDTKKVSLRFRFLRDKLSRCLSGSALNRRHCVFSFPSGLPGTLRRQLKPISQTYTAFSDWVKVNQWELNETLVQIKLTEILMSNSGKLGLQSFLPFLRALLCKSTLIPPRQNFIDALKDVIGN